ncbi:hypothetical protein TNCV_905161 [Trichonephila clavipes]|nr:hypothetical protein TNCV_905161 [Trichonephila clavipes]
MPPDRQQHQIKAHEIHCGKGLVVHLPSSIGLSTIQVTVLFASVPPQFCDRTPWGWSEATHFSPFLSNSLEDLRIDGYLECPYAPKALYIYKYPYLLRDSNPGPKA